MRAPLAGGAARRGDDRGSRLDTTAVKSSQAAGALHRIVASIRKSRADRVRIEISDYHGTPTISARVWFVCADNSERPTKHGFTLHVRHLPALARAFADAERVAREAGLLNDSRDDQGARR